MKKKKTQSERATELMNKIRYNLDFIQDRKDRGLMIPLQKLVELETWLEELDEIASKQYRKLEKHKEVMARK
jgi:hypothetical protein